MSRKPKSKHLLEKSIQAAISAIEIYNKPDFKYREESFCILMVNAWEVLLKAKIITTNQNKLNSIFVIDKNLKKKDGTEYKKTKYKKNRAGNEMTIDIFTSLKIIKDDTLKENIKLLVEMRDNAIHFYNESKYFEKKVLEIGTATLKSYVHCVMIGLIMIWLSIILFNADFIFFIYQMLKVFQLTKKTINIKIY